MPLFIFSCSCCEQFAFGQKVVSRPSGHLTAILVVGACLALTVANLSLWGSAGESRAV